MEHAELSSSVIFVCHVNFSRHLEAESAAFSVLFLKGPLNSRIFKKFKNFCISGGKFKGLSNGILFVFLLAVVLELFKITHLP